MGKITTIHGCIFVYLGNAEAPGFAARGAHNLEILARLPAQDGYPHLSRNMFAVTSSSCEESPFYKYQLIHFAAGMRYLDDAWAEWLAKFERLLGDLDWDRAELRLELEWPADGHEGTRFDYRWRRRRLDSGMVAWDFEGGPRSFAPAGEGASEPALPGHP